MASGSHRSGSNPSSSQWNWWDVVEIVEEENEQYRVRWAGKDPKTGKPWPLEWVPSSHCSTDLVRDWEKKKGKAKKQEPLASASAPMSTVAFKRPSEKRDAANTPAPTARKRKLPRATPSGSTDNAPEDSAPPRKKRLAAAVEKTPSGSHGGQSTAPPAPVLPNRKGRPTTTEGLPSHPPLEEIEMWVPTPNAKFGPPKRKRPAGERQDAPKEGRVDIAVPAKTPVPTPIPQPSPSRPLPLTDSQIVALREEEEESQSQSQSQPTSNQPGGTVNESAAGDTLPPTVKAKDAIRPTKPNVNDGRGLKTYGRGARSQSNVRDPIKQTLGVADDSGYRFNLLSPSPMSLFHPNPSTSANSSLKSQVEKSTQDEGVNTEDNNRIKPKVPVFDSNPPAGAISSSNSPQIEKPVKIDPPRNRKPSASSTKQYSSSRSEPSQTGSESLAKQRAIEGRARRDELLRAGKSVAAKRHQTLEASQCSERPPSQDILKRVREMIESQDGSQVTQLGNSSNEIPASASSDGNRRMDPSESREVLVTNKSGQDINTGSLSRTGDVLAGKVLVPNSEDEVPPTASNSTQSQSHEALPHASLDSQLAAALDLLHKKSEEISELQIQVNMLRVQPTEQSNGALRGKETIDYLATEVQTDRDNESYKNWDLERTRWAEEKLTLQGEAEALRGEKERAISDVDFFRAQYLRASDFASSMRSEKEELSARAALAESQATKGVALVRATFEGRVGKLEAEVRKYKALSEMLIERARRTDDDVRYRASILPEIEREFSELGGRFSELEAELEETKDELYNEKRTSSKLRRKVARLELKVQAADVEPGTIQSQDHMFWSDEKDDEDYDPTRSPSSSSRDSGGSSPQPQHQEDHSPHSEDEGGPADGEIGQVDSFGLGESTQPSSDDMVYLCQWRPGDPAENCDVVVSTKEELYRHVLSHHLACH